MWEILKVDQMCVFLYEILYALLYSGAQRTVVMLDMENIEQFLFYGSSQVLSTQMLIINFS